MNKRTLTRPVTSLCSIDLLHAIFSYDPETGNIARLIDQGTRGKKGAVLRPNKEGYITVRIQNSDYEGHRVAWAMYHGVWPIGVVDHINGMRGDNRIFNLRDVPVAVNVLNRTGPQKNKRESKLLGAFLDKRSSKWYSQMQVNGVVHNLGFFPSEEHAHQAYVAARTASINERTK